LDSRLAIISGATFAGVIGAAALIAGLPGFASDSDDSSAGSVAPISTTAPASDNSGFAPALDTALSTGSGATTFEASFSDDSSDHEAVEHQSKDSSHHDGHDSHDVHDDGEDD
jgi:hypothetical protein